MSVTDPNWSIPVDNDTIEELISTIDKYLERKKYVEYVTKMKYTMNAKIVEMGEDGAFKGVEARGDDPSNQQPNSPHPLPGPHTPLHLAPIRVLYDCSSNPVPTVTLESYSNPEEPTVTLEDSLEGSEPTKKRGNGFNFERINSKESFVTTPNGTMRVPNSMMKSELEKYQMDTDPFQNSCGSCKKLQERVETLEERIHVESEEKRRIQREASELNMVYHRRELFWMDQTNHLIQKVEWYKSISKPPPISLIPDTIAMAPRVSSSSTPLLVYSTLPSDPPILDMAPPRIKKPISLPDPLDPRSDAYKVVFAQAMRNCETCPLYKDPKLTIQSCLFNPSSSEIMPQLVKNPSGAYFLYRKWREGTANWMSNMEIAKEWSDLKNSSRLEYLDWKRRADSLYAEHYNQLSKGYIRVISRKRRAKKVQ